jgi:hypothetical protein
MASDDETGCKGEEREVSKMVGNLVAPLVSNKSVGRSVSYLSWELLAWKERTKTSLSKGEGVVCLRSFVR